MKRFHVVNGAPFVVDDAMCIGKGAEGAAYRVGNQVFKHQLLDPTQTDPFHLQKLGFLVREGFSKTFKRSCYPSAIVVDEFNNYCGWFSRYVPDAETIHDLHDKGVVETWSLRQRLSAMLAVALVVSELHTARRYRFHLGDGLKPANLMMNRDTLACHGIDCLSHSVCGFRPQGANRLVNAYCSLTSPGYIAKERLETPDLHPTASSDIFQLCLVLHLIGYDHHACDPHPMDTVDWDRDRAVLNGQFFRYVQVPGFRSPDYKTALPLALDDVLKRGLLGKPHERSSIQEIVDVLTAELFPYSWRNRARRALPSRRQVAGMAASLLLGASGATYFANKTMAPAPAQATPAQAGTLPLPAVPRPAPVKPPLKPDAVLKKPSGGIGPAGLKSLK